MQIDDARQFIQDHHHAVLSTYRADGGPQLSPVTVAIDDKHRVLVSTRETAVKTKHARRDPRVSLCVLSDTFYGPWIRIDGRAEVVSLPDAMDLLVDYYRRAAGVHPDWDDYRAAMERERRVVLRIEIDVVGPDISG